jgi:hypothetical protein
VILAESILQDDLVNNLSAKDTSPPEKFLSDSVEFFINHCPLATVTFHGSLLLPSPYAVVLSQRVPSSNRRRE